MSLSINYSAQQHS